MKSRVPATRHGLLCGFSYTEYGQTLHGKEERRNAGVFRQMLATFEQVFGSRPGMGVNCDFRLYVKQLRMGF